MLDISLIDFVSDSITIDGVKAESSQYTWDAGTGKLSITLSDIAAKANSTVTFKVSKRA